MTDDHRYDEHVVVLPAQTRTINGAVTAGITVQQSARATVNGAFGGQVIVEEFGRLTILGAGSLDAGSRVSGVLTLGGIWNGDIAGALQPGGKLLVAVGSWVEGVDGRHFELMPDGSVEHRPPGHYESVNVDAGRVYRYDPDSLGFIVA